MVFSLIGEKFQSSIVAKILYYIHKIKNIFIYINIINN